MGPFPLLRGSRVDRPPPGRHCPLTLALQTLPTLPPLKACLARLALPPALTLPQPLGLWVDSD